VTKRQHCISDNSDRASGWKKCEIKENRVILHEKLLNIIVINNTHLTALCPGLSGWAGARKYSSTEGGRDVTYRMLLEKETVGGSGVSWAICQSAPRPIQITMPLPVPFHSDFYRTDALPSAQTTVSKHWRQFLELITRTVLWLFVHDYPGAPVPEDSLTRTYWLSAIRCQLLPSTMIHRICPVKFMWLTVFLHNLSPSPLWSTFWSGTLHFILHTFLHPVIVFFLQHMPIPSQPGLL